MGFSLLLQPDNLFASVMGTVLGLIVGLLPGLSPAMGVALIVPFTFSMAPLPAIIMLTALYGAGQYGGSITAITVNTPGEPASAATTLDGYPMTLKGLTGKAIRVSLYSSCFGGFMAAILVIAFSIPIARFALEFGPAEYFALAIFGLTMVVSLSGKNIIKGLIAVMIGLLINTIGVDPFTGQARFVFNSLDLYEGIDFIPALIGLYALSEVFRNFEKGLVVKKVQQSIGKQLPTLQEIKGLLPTWMRSLAIGTFVGAVPGAGATIAAFIGYNEAKRFSKHPEEFGKGCLEGVAGPECANDSAVKGSFVPLITLGIPGSGTTAIILGAFIMHGLVPGPLLFKEHPDIVYGLFSSFFVSTLVILIMGILFTRILIKAVSLPNAVIAPCILALCFIGAYSNGNSMFNVYVMLGFGIMGYLFSKIDIP
ncbi:MAG: tripartite tricarboxylate transporter permease, partial [Desulfocucumaceae bacterium]